MRYINKFFEALITLLFVAIVIVGSLQVFNRFALNISLSWSEEFQKFAFVWVVFLAIPVAYNRMAHLRVDSFFERFPAEVQRMMQWVIDLLWMGLGICLMVFTWRLMQVTKYQLSPGLGISMSIVYSGMAIGGAYLVLCVLAKIVARITKTEVAAP
jgi:TRAP-type C4-dicarboxylate transport system permease small subunit